MPEVFVSHAGRDRAWAEWVAWQLEQAGVSVELDFWDWRAGDNFVAKMNRALASCTSMVALCSGAYFEPERWTSEEWTAAVALGKERPNFLVPVRIDDAPVPPILRPLIAAQLVGLPADRARAELLRAVRREGRPPVEPAFPGTDGSRSLGSGPRLPGVLPPVWGEVPTRNADFTGRDAMLMRLREMLCGSHRSVVRALNGVGGVGKTQLAAEYAWRFANDYDAVWWVRAEQADLIGEQLAAFAVDWRLADPAEQIGPAVQALRRHCRQYGRWLLVLDNATSADHVRDWLLAGPGHLLVTSRDPYWPEIATSMTVDVFARVESVALLQTRLPGLVDDDAGRLAVALGDLPLAIAQAAGLLAETGMSADEYLELLRESAAEVLSEGRPSSYPVPLAAAVRIAVDRLAREDEVARQLLVLCAHLAPEPISLRWFTDAGDGVLPEPLATAIGKSLVFRNTLSRLRRYGLVKISDDRMQLHRLTQAVLRNTIPADERAKAAAMVEIVLGTTDPGKASDPNAWPAWAELVPHFRMVDLNGADNSALCWQVCEGARYLLSRGDASASYELIDQLYRAWHTRLGPDHQHTLWAAHSLAATWRALGRYQEAHNLDADTLDRCRRVWGSDDVFVLAVTNSLADDLVHLGHHQQAHDLDTDTFNRRRRILGPDHPDTLTSANNLAASLILLGHHQQAHDLNTDTFNRRRRILGPDHPDTLQSANNLVIDLVHLGHHQQAHDLSTDTFNRRRRILGPDHPDTLQSANNLAETLRNFGRHQEAHDLDTDTLDRFRRILGPDHPDTLVSAGNLVSDLRNLGHHREAEDLDADTESRRKGLSGSSYVIW